jgi:hypothetical protein
MWFHLVRLTEPEIDSDWLGQALAYATAFD